MSIHSIPNRRNKKVKRLTKLLIAASAVAVGVAWMAIPASADGPSGYGFSDDSPHVITMGGSDTTYKIMQGVSDLYNQSAGCLNSTAADTNLNTCLTTPGTPDTTSADTGGAFANWEHDGVLNLYSTGSGAGRASVRQSSARDASCLVKYAGAVNNSPGFTNCPNVDVARSSSSPDAGDVTSGDEVGWGVAQDGVQVTVFDSRATQLFNALPDNGGAGSASLLTAADLFHIWNCDYRTWSQVPSLAAAVTAGQITDGPIVPFAMNTSSGTFGTFSSFITTNAPGEGAVVPANWTPDTQAHMYTSSDPLPGNSQCVLRINTDSNTSVKPFENDIKPLIDFPAALSSSPSSIDNPANWIWWDSFGELKSFSFKSKYSAGGIAANPVHQAFPAPVEGIIPAGGNIQSQTYPITRVLYVVTRGTDADCPQSVAHTCNFSLTNASIPAAPNVFGTATPDLNVFGTTRASGGVTPVTPVVNGALTNGGTSGSIRELIRFMCRTSAQNVGKDPFTGLTYDAAITKVYSGNNFTGLKAGTNTAGSRCKVVT
jgi:ABC-type phosphate transport system substrate-binding protein